MIPPEVRNMTPLQGKERLGANRDSEYMGALDFDPGAEPVLTIKAIYNDEVTLGMKKEKKDFIVFAEDSVPAIKNVRPLIINTENLRTLIKLFGGSSAELLVGKRIQLYLKSGVRNPRTGETGEGIRIRNKIPEDAKVPCEECGQMIAPAFSMSVTQLAAYTRKKYGKALCAECAKAAKEEQLDAAE